MKKKFVPIIGLLTVSPLPAIGQSISLTEDKLIVSNMNGLKEKVAQQIRQLREQKYTCSQATFLGICKTLGSDLTEDQIMAISSGFAGGIGRTFNEGTCGALVAGSMALGLYLPGQNEKTIALSKELFDYFKQRQGTVICGNITQKHGFTRCTGCCICVGEKVAELLQRENISISAQSLVSWDDAIKKIGNS